MVYAGTSLAFVLGGPLSSAIGQSWGWRTASAAIGVVAVGIAFSLHRALPEMPVDQHHRSKRDKPKPTPAMKRALAVICAATLFAALGQFASYTFFTLLVEESLGSSGGIRTAMLLVYGAAGAVGVWVAGKYYDADHASSRSSRSRRWQARWPSSGSWRRRWERSLSSPRSCGVRRSPPFRSASSPRFCAPSYRDRPCLGHLRCRVPDRDCNGRSARCGRRRQWRALTSGGHRGRSDDRFVGDSRVRPTRVSPGTGTVYSLPHRRAGRTLVVDQGVSPEQSSPDPATWQTQRGRAPDVSHRLTRFRGGSCHRLQCSEATRRCLTTPTTGLHTVANTDRSASVAVVDR